MSHMMPMRRMRRIAAPALLLAAVCGGVPLLLGGNQYVVGLLVAALVIGGVALSWAMAGNLGGMVSFGHSAFFGVGAYVSAIAAARLGLPVPAALLLGGAGAALAAVAMLPALRLRGPYFALAILAYAHIFRILATEWRTLTGGASGLARIAALPQLPGLDARSSACLLLLGIVLLFALIYAVLRASHAGLALRAMHDSEDALRAVGVNTTLLKGLTLLLSAFMAGVCGAFNAHYIGFLDPDYAFSGEWVTLPIVAALAGGYRSIAGPLAGALLVYLADQLLFKALMPNGHQLVLGALLVALILFSPSGLLALLHRPQERPDA